MRLIRERKAVSTLIVILLVLCSLIIGGLTSYVWVLSNYYLEPENKVQLIITDLNFAVDHANYFYMTVMNPSHSPSGTNITQIYYTVEGESNYHNVSATEPESMPVRIERGTTKTLKCTTGWGEFAGKNITVYVVPLEGSGASLSVKTKFVGLDMGTRFNATDSAKYFNVTLKNHEYSTINLTLINVYFNYYTSIPHESISISLPKTLENGTLVSFDCTYNWNNTVNPTILVETAQGYIAYVTANVSATANLAITTPLAFNESDPSEFNVTVANFADSSTSVNITSFDLTYDNGTQYHISSAYTSPSLPYKLNINSTGTIACKWNWTNYRDRNVTITANTKQGFVFPSKTVKTPSPVIFKIAAVDFNMTDSGFFLVNVTNMPSSTKSINVTQINLNNNVTSFQPQIIPVGETMQLNCTFNWTSLKGTTATVTVYIADGLLQANSTILPSVDLQVSDTIVFGTTPEGFKYVNITILNSAFSAREVTITQILFKTENKTDSIDGTISNPQFAPTGYALPAGSSVTMACIWNWTPYLGEDVTITVQTADGLTASRTFNIPLPPP